MNKRFSTGVAAGGVFIVSALVISVFRSLILSWYGYIYQELFIISIMALLAGMVIITLSYIGIRRAEAQELAMLPPEKLSKISWQTALCISIILFAAGIMLMFTRFPLYLNEFISLLLLTAGYFFLISSDYLKLRNSFVISDIAFLQPSMSPKLSPEGRKSVMGLTEVICAQINYMLRSSSGTVKDKHYYEELLAFREELQNMLTETEAEPYENKKDSSDSNLFYSP